MSKYKIKTDLDICNMLICMFAIAVMTLILCWPISGHDFLNLDDHAYVVLNYKVVSGLNWDNFTWAFTSIGYEANWHPLTWLTHMLDVEMFGMNPGKHHLVNILFHVVNTVILFVVFSLLTTKMWQSAFVAILFSIHPLHVESVAWIAERKDVLSTFFWMLTLGAYFWYQRDLSKSKYVLVIASFALGLLSKPMLVTLPIVLLLLDYWPLRRAQIPAFANNHVDSGKSFRPILKEKIPLFVLALASGVMTLVAQSTSGAVKSFESYPLSIRIENAVVAYAGYVFKALWPTQLAVYYPHPGEALSLTLVAGAAVLLVGITLLVFRFSSGREYLIVGWLWYLITLLPVIGLIQVGGQAMADRYTYLPLIGIFIMVAWGMPELAGSLRLSKWSLVVPAIVVLVLLFLTSRQISYWRNDETLFTHAIKVTTGNWMAHSVLGKFYFDRGDLSKSIAHSEEVLKIRPAFADAYINLGGALTGVGRFSEAEKRYLQALQLKPDFPEAYSGLGKLYADTGRIDEAISSQQKALQMKPEFPEAHVNLGLAFYHKGNLDAAIAEYRKALAINPRLLKAYNNLGNALDDQGKVEEALVQYGKAMEINPNNPVLHFNMALALEKTGARQAAIQHYQEAIRLKPDYIQARQQLVKFRH